MQREREEQANPYFSEVTFTFSVKKEEKKHGHLTSFFSPSPSFYIFFFLLHFLFFYFFFFLLSMFNFMMDHQVKL